MKQAIVLVNVGFGEYNGAHLAQNRRVSSASSQLKSGVTA